MKDCVICKSRYQKGDGVTFHKFPSDERRLELWLKNIKKPSWRPKKYDYICSKHFSDNCFIKHNSCTTLKKCSIPTIFCSNAESSPLKHEKMDAPTPVSETKMVTLAPPVPETAVDVKIPLIMVQNNNNMYGQKRRSTSSDLQQNIALKKIKLESDPLTYENMVSQTLSVSGTRMVTRTPSISEAIAVKVKTELIMEENDTNWRCRRTSYDSKQNVRSLSEVCDNIKNDHPYVITPRSSEIALQRLKNSLIKSRAREKVLAQHVKRLKASVSSLRTVISKLKKKG